jgi:hypothetical protein
MKILAFNNTLQKELQDLVYEIEKKDFKKQQNYFPDNVSAAKRVLLFLPSFLGILFHLPLFFAVKLYAHMQFRNSGHYDSVMTALLMLLYPLYILIISFYAGSYNFVIGMAAAVILPFTVWCFAQINYRLIPQ